MAYSRSDGNSSSERRSFWIAASSRYRHWPRLRLAPRGTAQGLDAYRIIVGGPHTTTCAPSFDKPSPIELTTVGDVANDGHFQAFDSILVLPNCHSQEGPALGAHGHHHLHSQPRHRDNSPINGGTCISMTQHNDIWMICGQVFCSVEQGFSNDTTRATGYCCER